MRLRKMEAEVEEDAREEGGEDAVEELGGEVAFEKEGIWAPKACQLKMHREA